MYLSVFAYNKFFRCGVFFYWFLLTYFWNTPRTFVFFFFLENNHFDPPSLLGAMVPSEYAFGPLRKIWQIYITKAFRSIKSWMWNSATAPAWSDQIHVTLWRNDGFLHSLCNFSKNNAFGKNFIRTKFILHKIFFRMSILLRRKALRRKTSWMFFNLCWKNCDKPFVGGYDHFERKEVSGAKN